MGVLISAESEYGKELARWNKPYEYQPFPKMVYKARERADGTIVCMEANSDGEHQRSDYEFANDERELRRLMEAGYRSSPLEAIELAKAKLRKIADATAHRHYEDRNLSEAAQAEAKAVDDATPEQVPEIPKRRGRPKGSKNKAQPTAA